MKTPPTYNPNQTRAAMLAGERDADIAVAQGVTRQRIGQLRRKWGIPPSDRGLDMAQYKALYAEMLTDKEIAQIMGVKPCRVEGLRRRLGLPSARTVRRMRIQALLKAGRSVAEIAPLVRQNERQTAVLAREYGVRQRAFRRKKT